jgi:hypothetical protein
MNLYKYCQPKRKDILENCSLRFSPVDALNDPFECLANTTILEEPKIKERLIHNRDIDESVRAAMENRPKRVTRDDLRVALEEVYPRTLPELKDGLHKAMRESRKSYRILCFSRVPPDDPRAVLLWGHYTNDDMGRCHAGFVLEFDRQHSWIRWHEQGNSEKRDAGPVNYREKSPCAQINADDILQVTREAVFTKSLWWKHEAEYRLLRAAGDDGLDASKVDSLATFPPEALVSVTFGINTDPKIKTAIRSICAGWKSSHRVRFLETNIHPDEYRLNKVSDVK